MKLVLVIGVIAAALVAIVVIAGLLAQRRREQEASIERFASQHLLGERLPPPVDRSIHLPHTEGAEVFDDLDDLREP